MRQNKGWIVALCLFCILPAKAALAQKLMANFEKPLPVFTLLPEEEFQEQTTLYEEKSAGDKSLSYSIRLPKDWTGLDGAGAAYQAGERILGKFTRYLGPVRVEPRSYFSVQAQALEFEMPVKYWFLQHVLSGGYALEGITIRDDKNLEALYVLVEGDASYVVRVKAIKNGKHVILARYAIPVSQWADEKIMQAQAIESFSLLSPSSQEAEPTKLYQFLDISQFRYPESWDLKAPILRSADRMNVKLINARKESGRRDRDITLDGKIEVFAVSQYAAGKLSEEVQRFKDELAQKGLTFGDLIEQKKDLPMQEGVKLFVMESYQAKDATNKIQDYEFWFSILSLEDYYYFITLLTSARDSDFMIWVRNTETYKLLVKSLQSAAFTHNIDEDEEK